MFLSDALAKFMEDNLLVSKLGKLSGGFYFLFTYNNSSAVVVVYGDIKLALSYICVSVEALHTSTSFCRVWHRFFAEISDRMSSQRGADQICNAHFDSWAFSSEADFARRFHILNQKYYLFSVILLVKILVPVKPLSPDNSNRRSQFKMLQILEETTSWPSVSILIIYIVVGKELSVIIIFQIRHKSHRGHFRQFVANLSCSDASTASVSTDKSILGDNFDCHPTRVGKSTGGAPIPHTEN